jgi:hypothetical protein
MNISIVGLGYVGTVSTADLCVDPDPFTDWSNLSTMNTIIEYMAFGRPIV